MVVVHGLWMGAWQMRPLQQALARAGLASWRYHYSSALRPYLRNQDGLARFIAERIGAPCDFVAHSMGGLLVLDLLAREPALCAGRVICLGAPINGSAVIGRMQCTPLQRFLGHANAPLLRGIERAPANVEVSMIAGTRSLGGGKLLHRFAGENDGSVAVQETQTAWLHQHECLPLSHTQLALSMVAHARVVALLRR